MPQDLILQKQITDLSLCDKIIEAHNNSIQVHTEPVCSCCSASIKKVTKSGWHFDPNGEQGRHLSWMNELLIELSVGFQNYQELYEHSMLNQLQVSPTWDDFNIQSYEPKEGYFKWHSEASPELSIMRTRWIVWMLYLNDVPDGGTEFLYQDLQVDAEKGKLVIWPAFFTHTHRGIVSNTTKKIIVTGWGNYA